MQFLYRDEPLADVFEVRMLAKEAFLPLHEGLSLVYDFTLVLERNVELVELGSFRFLGLLYCLSSDWVVVLFLLDVELGIVFEFVGVVLDVQILTPLEGFRMLRHLGVESLGKFLLVFDIY